MNEMIAAHISVPMQAIRAFCENKVDLIDRGSVEQSPNYLRRRSVLESAEVIYAA